MGERVRTGLSNYYGEVSFMEQDGKHTMELEDVFEMETIKISKEFYDIAVREFKGREKK